LGRILEKQGKRVSYFTPTPPSKIFNFLPDIKKIKTKFDYKDYDILVFVDLTSYQRVSPFADHRKKYFDDHTIIVFDHHLDTAVEHALVIKDTKIMSCAELIFEKAKKRRKKDIDKNVATYFYL
jgi:nanoRNase/pAp phosphatase (c-di-AMP/oligoRNAs hydrolase)